ncbi:MAG: phage virion morphogenesis protein [Salipiger marinus]|uniref:phage virion morphogenesis protein n=1 Tax=Salipiger marinus TaxID=555512 RepID=UPI004059FFF0
MALTIGFNTELRDADARRALEEMLQRMENKRPFYAAVGQRMVDSTTERFDLENAPDGTPWAALRAATIKARERRKQIPVVKLRAEGHLKGSIYHVATAEEVRVGSPVEYAAIHQLGGTINKPARQAKIYRKKDEAGQVGRRFVSKDDANHVTDVTIPAHKITIPARPYLGLSAADEEGVLEDAETWLLM